MNRAARRRAERERRQQSPTSDTDAAAIPSYEYAPWYCRTHARWALIFEGVDAAAERLECSRDEDGTCDWAQAKTP